MKKEIIIREKQSSSARMSAALDLLIDFLLEEYGKESGLCIKNGGQKRKPKPMFHNKSNHKLI